MWGKLIRYAHLHDVDPDKYPAGRTPVELSDFLSDVKELMQGFFTDSDSILGKMFIFFLDNPCLVFMIAFAFAFCAFNLVRYSFKVVRV